MSRQATSFVLGYHGCDRNIANKIVNLKKQMEMSTNRYDWLGSGIYFWEADPMRAWEWAEAKAKQKRKAGEIYEPAVIGAAIDLGNCLDLMNRRNLETVKNAYLEYKQSTEDAGAKLLRNRDPKGVAGIDRLLRELDCAVVNFLHALIEDPEAKNFDQEEFDTVRGLFQEDEELYPGAGFRRKSHIQIAVRNPECIRGYFLVLKPD